MNNTCSAAPRVRFTYVFTCQSSAWEIKLLRLFASVYRSNALLLSIFPISKEQAISNAVASALHILCPRTEVRNSEGSRYCSNHFPKKRKCGYSTFMSCVPRSNAFSSKAPKSRLCISAIHQGRNRKSQSVFEIRAKIKVFARRRVAA